ncbi:aminopeptidase [candidate division KSB1 bacterium]|nr:aminopeptidase [candidate division KSB1 bacterium]
MTRYEKAVRTIIHTCVRLKDRESLLIVVDEEHRETGKLLQKTALRVSPHVFLLEYSDTGGARSQISPKLSNLLIGMNSVIFASSRSFIGSQELQTACHHGVRVLCISDVGQEAIARCVNTDFKYIADKSRRIADLLSIGKKLKITTRAGTELSAMINNRSAVAETGIVEEAGLFSSLPSGKATIMPQRFKMDGVLIVDGSFSHNLLNTESLRLDIKGGYVRKIYGNDGAVRLRKLLDKVGRNGREIIEIGLGTNPKALLSGQTSEDDKVHGTVHIVLGNRSDDRKFDYVTNRITLIIKSPTLGIDNHLLIQDGLFKV